MFGRTAESVITKIMVLTLVLATTQASPIGFYLKGSGLFFWGSENSKKENIACSVTGIWQPNRDNSIEISLIPPLTTIKGSDGAALKNSWTFIKKNLIPLKYYLNVYTQAGCSWKQELGLHAPLVGLGISYYHNRLLHVDVSWRNYTVLRANSGLFNNNDGKLSTKYRGNCIVVGVGLYIR